MTLHFTWNKTAEALETGKREHEITGGTLRRTRTRGNISGAVAAVSGGRQATGARDSASND
ncbi:MAG TPA: hypothetical protein VIY69_09300 [Candidatus Acidoferrales bacterium]